MLKLGIVTLIAFLVPVFFVIGAKAQTGMSSRQAWAQTYDLSGLSPAQRQAIKARQEINDRIAQIYDGFRRVDADSQHYATARGLTVAAEHLQNYSNQTSDYFALESYVQQIRDLQAALQVLVRLR